MMIPTHRHADGGLYRYVGPQSAKGDGDQSVWIEGVEYSDLEGRKFWTTQLRWSERFEELSVEMVSEEQVDLEDDEGNIIASFVFTLHEAGDLRHMLITSGPQPSVSLQPEQRAWLRRILDAMAEQATQGLHIRDHDFPDLIGDVAAFHAKFGQEYTGKPRMLPQDLHEFRVKFHEEETTEYADEYNALADAVVRQDRRDIISALEKQLDGLCDSAWVILGTADLQFGRRAFIEAWRRVVKANMAKVRKDVAGDGHQDSGRAPKYDIVKPAGWIAPDHRDLVQDNAIFDEIFALPAPDIESNTFNEDVDRYSDTRRI